MMRKIIEQTKSQTLCFCGCGELTSPGMLYLHGHNNPYNSMNEKQKERRLKKFRDTWEKKKDRGYVSPCKGKKNPNMGWAKGLTKENDERIKRLSKSEKRWWDDPKNSDAIKERNKKISENSAFRRPEIIKANVEKMKKLRLQNPEKWHNLCVRNSRVLVEMNTDWEFYERYGIKKNNIYPHYNKIWERQRKKVRKRAGCQSELSGDDGVLHTHHIYSFREFYKICYQLYIEPYVILFNQSVFDSLPGIIPDIIIEEAHSSDNLIVLTKDEHYELEGMPPTFFFEVMRENAKECVGQ